MHCVVIILCLLCVLFSTGKCISGSFAVQLRVSFDQQLKETLQRLPPRLAAPLRTMQPGQALRALLEISAGKSSLRATDVTLVQKSVEKGVLEIIKRILHFLISFLGSNLDPLWIGNYKFNISGEGVQVRLSLENIRIAHLLSTEVIDYGVSTTSLCAYGDVLLPQLDISTFYDLDGSAEIEGMSIDYFGDGPMKIQVTDTKAHAALCIMFPDGAFAVQMQELQISVRALQVKIHNLFHDETVAELISGIVSDVGPAAVDDLQPVIVQSIMEAVNKVLKDLLPFSTIKDFNSDHLGL